MHQKDKTKIQKIGTEAKQTKKKKNSTNFFSAHFFLHEKIAKEKRIKFRKKKKQMFE